MDSEIHHHDPVLLDDADQQDDADQRDHRQVVTADPQDQQRTEAGRRQRRQDRQRVDVALVQQAEHDVHGDQRGRDQVRLRRQRVAERLRRTLEAAEQRGRGVHLALRRVDRLRGVAERVAGREVERQRDRGELPLVADRQVRGLRRVDVHERRQRHLLVRDRRRDVELVEDRRILLHLRRRFENHVVAVELREVLRDLALADRVVQRRVDQRRRDPEARRARAVDRQRRGTGRVLLVGRDVGDLLQLPEAVEHPWGPRIELVEVRVGQRVLVLRP